MKNLQKVISGGQTGVDLAALRAAETCGLALGGWCPPGRVCESGRIPDRFPLQEAPQDRSPHAPEIARSLRTEWNVRDSNGTLVLRRLIPAQTAHRDAGTTWTFECATLYGKPLLLCDPDDPDNSRAQLVAEWLNLLNIQVLNVAGPAESTQTGIGALAEAFLLEVFQRMQGVHKLAATNGLV